MYCAHLYPLIYVTSCFSQKKTRHIQLTAILDRKRDATIKSNDQKPIDLIRICRSCCPASILYTLYKHLPLLLSRLLLPLALEADGVVLPRGAGRRRGPPRQETEEEAAGRRALQRPALERLHAASRSLAAAWQERDEEEQQERGPAEKLRRQEPPPAASLPTAPHAAGW